MAVISNLPKWATPDRRKHLVALFENSGGFCVFGHNKCLIPEHHYHIYIEDLIADWKADDREQALTEWEAEQRAIHSLGELRYPLLGRFNAISREIYGGSQPLFYIQDLGISGLTLKPFAKVRLSSSYETLYVELRNALWRVSKARRRKAIRYHKPLPKEVEEDVFRIVKEAVRDYLAH